MVECISMSTMEYFDGNPIAEALRLRYKELVIKENWANVKIQPDKQGNLEYDQFDTVSTQYLVKRNEQGTVLATGRVKPTTCDYMLSDVFRELCQDTPIHSPNTVEGSRVVVNRDIGSQTERRRTVDEILVAYMEISLHMGADSYVAFMLPKVWEATFKRIGWEPTWLGPECIIEHSGEVVRAGILPVNQEINQVIRKNTGLQSAQLDFGKNPDPRYDGPVSMSRFEPTTIIPLKP